MSLTRLSLFAHTTQFAQCVLCTCKDAWELDWLMKIATITTRNYLSIMILIKDRRFLIVFLHISSLLKSVDV